LTCACLLRVSCVSLACLLRVSCVSLACLASRSPAPFSLQGAVARKDTDDDGGQQSEVASSVATSPSSLSTSVSTSASSHSTSTTQFPSAPAPGHVLYVCECVRWVWQYMLRGSAWVRVSHSITQHVSSSSYDIHVGRASPVTHPRILPCRPCPTLSTPTHTNAHQRTPTHTNALQRTPILILMRVCSQSPRRDVEKKNGFITRQRPYHR
jgi:hypothetical protein